MQLIIHDSLILMDGWSIFVKFIKADSKTVHLYIRFIQGTCYQQYQLLQYQSFANIIFMSHNVIIRTCMPQYINNIQDDDADDVSCGGEVLVMFPENCLYSEELVNLGTCCCWATAGEFVFALFPFVETLALVVLTRSMLSTMASSDLIQVGFGTPFSSVLIQKTKT